MLEVLVDNYKRGKSEDGTCEQLSKSWEGVVELKYSRQTMGDGLNVNGSVKFEEQ